MLQIFIPKERRLGETRVSGTPETVKKLVKLGCEVQVEAGAGKEAHLPDSAYEAAGATLVRDAAAGWSGADVVLTVSPLQHSDALGKHEVEALKEGAMVVGFLDPYNELDTVRRLAERKITALALELVPRISRAQSMDALSSQASIGGEKEAVAGARRPGAECGIVGAQAARNPRRGFTRQR